MSQVVRLSDGCWIDPDLVASVTKNFEARTVTVRMHDGIGHTIHVGYSNSLFAAAENVIDMINAARTK